ncbi:hypothetical protein NLU13_2146 [Sarocladium strictum]|uniref:Uncharacterized protein n=1 Tax=Sarocladium strictum TaxID=5046 RepID=A0AA39GT42_SARSR|nr:hypothetical protein NLU13_2146 [Sarocladium strictum]
MSAVAIPFDPTFTLGPRSNYTWPGPFEPPNSSEVINTRDCFSISAHSGDSPLPGTSTRSLTASPPQLQLTPEQRELKRQQDRARRGSRLNARFKRESSNTPFFDSPPPMHLPDGSTAAIEMSQYSAAPTQMALLSDPSSLPAGHYMSSYSPPLPETQPAAPMFPTPYQQPLPGSYSMPMEYPASYSSPTAFPTRSPPSLSVGPDAGMMYQMPPVMASGGSAVVAQQEAGHVRVVQSRPKPRCWEHGCNGRQFSTFSNLLRHQREKSGQAIKASCPNCGAEFTRTTARNGHLLHDKCKQRRNS